MASVDSGHHAPTSASAAGRQPQLCYQRRVLLEDAVLPDPWVSVEDVARHLGVSKDTIYRWIDAQRLPAHKVGRFWKFKLQEIDDWVRDGGAAGAGNPGEPVQR